MKLRVSSLALALTVSLCLPHIARAQADAKQDTKAAAKSMPTALMVEVTLSRYQGDKRVSSLPYTLAVTPDSNRSNLRVGGQIPIPTTTVTPASSANDKAAAAASYSYRDIGTNIDVTATPADDGRYRVVLAVEENSIYPPAEAAKNSISPTGAPAFRSLRSSNTVILRDGQLVEYVAATDRITGETARISVKLTVLK